MIARAKDVEIEYECATGSLQDRSTSPGSRVTFADQTSRRAIGKDAVKVLAGQVYCAVAARDASATSVTAWRAWSAVPGCR